MPRFKVPTTFTFPGVFEIEASSPAQAKLFVKERCGLVLGGHIHSILSDEDVNWEFAMHPDKLIGEPEKIKT